MDNRVKDVTQNKQVLLSLCYQVYLCACGSLFHVFLPWMFAQRRDAA